MVLNLKMITEDYCSYEVANILNEKGFPFEDIEYPKVINAVGLFGDTASILGHAHICNGTEIPTCTHQMALKWLRSRGIFIEVKIGEFGDKFIYFLTTQNGCGVWGKDSKVIGSPAHVEYDSYEDAVEAALKYSLTNLI